MLSSILTTAAIAVAGVSAARPWLNEPDTGLEAIVSNISVGALPPLDEIVGLPDFDCKLNPVAPSCYIYTSRQTTARVIDATLHE